MITIVASNKICIITIVRPKGDEVNKAIAGLIASGYFVLNMKGA